MSQPTDWVSLLRHQQQDFIARLESGHLISSSVSGCHSESVIISGERLKALREFCWEMAEKYKRGSNVKSTFINNLKGKLGEEIVKRCLGDFITEVDYQRKIGGDGKIDFMLSSDSSKGIQVKTRTLKKGIDITWMVSLDEIQKNVAIACILVEEEINEAQTEYHLIFAGFMPTCLLSQNQEKQSIKIDELLYSSGIKWYLNNEKTLIDQSNIDNSVNAISSPMLDIVRSSEAQNKDQFNNSIYGVYNQQETGAHLDFDTYEAEWQVGNKVVHDDYGHGKVIDVFGTGKTFCLAIDFFGRGCKIIDPEETCLKKIDKSQDVVDSHLSDGRNSWSKSSRKHNSEISLPQGKIQRRDSTMSKTELYDFDWQVGDMVFHRTYGSGQVTHVFGTGNNKCLTVQFSGQGRKVFDPKRKLLKKIGKE